jgi:hypothetical protein
VNKACPLRQGATEEPGLEAKDGSDLARRLGAPFGTNDVLTPLSGVLWLDRERGDLADRSPNVNLRKDIDPRHNSSSLDPP